MTAPYTLVSFDLCPYVQRAAIVLAEKGIPFTRRDVDLSNKPDWFKAISPLGKVPLLMVGQEVLFESSVIVEYLEEVTDQPLHPADPLTRARHRAWMEFGSAMLADIWVVETTQDDALFAQKRTALRDKALRLEAALGQGRFWQVLVETGQVTVSVLFLVMAASFFSRMLAMSGLPAALGEALLSGPIGPWGFLVIYLLVVILLGCIIDSISIMLILLPIAVPVAQAAGFDMIWFGVMTVVAVEIGLLTPPFGLSVFTIKSAMNDPTLKVGTIFRGTMPFVLAMILALVILSIFPGIATWLARV